MNFKPKRSLGQNFLVDPWVIQQIITTIALQPKQNIIEIGPGLGAITGFILAKDVNLTAIELDRDLYANLNNKFAAAITNKQLKLIQQDILKVDLMALMNNQKFRLVGNLPYNISTPLLFKLLTNINYIIDMHFLVQKELAERLVALPSSKQYGRLSIMTQYYSKVELLFGVTANAFKPMPKVQSSMIRLIPYEVLPYQAQNFTKFAQIVLLAFCQRRKSLARIFKAYCSNSDLITIAIDPKARPEQLTVADFVKFSNFLSAHGR